MFIRNAIIVLGSLLQALACSQSSISDSRGQAAAPANTDESVGDATVSTSSGSSPSAVTGTNLFRKENARAVCGLEVEGVRRITCRAGNVNLATSKVEFPKAIAPGVEPRWSLSVAGRTVAPADCHVEYKVSGVDPRLLFACEVPSGETAQATLIVKDESPGEVQVSVPVATGGTGGNFIFLMGPTAGFSAGGKGDFDLLCANALASSPAAPFFKANGAGTKVAALLNTAGPADLGNALTAYNRSLPLYTFEAKAGALDSFSVKRVTSTLERFWLGPFNVDLETSITSGPDGRYMYGDFVWTGMQRKESDSTTIGPSTNACNNWTTPSSNPTSFYGGVGDIQPLSALGAILSAHVANGRKDTDSCLHLNFMYCVFEGSIP